MIQQRLLHKQQQQQKQQQQGIAITNQIQQNVQQVININYEVQLFY